MPDRDGLRPWCGPVRKVQWSLAVDVAVDSIAVATLGLGGQLFNRIRVARPRGRSSPEKPVEDVVKLAQPLLSSLPAEHTFSGVGVAVVAITRRSDGFVHLAADLGWRDVPLVEDSEGVWESASGCMRAYLNLAAKARRFADDQEIQGRWPTPGRFDLAESSVGEYSEELAKKTGRRRVSIPMPSPPVVTPTSDWTSWWWI